MRLRYLTPFGVIEGSDETRAALKERGIKPSQETMKPLQVEIQVWEPNPDKKGYLRYVCNRSREEVRRELQAMLVHYDSVPDEYGFTHCHEAKAIKDTPFPDFHWIASFVVTGSNEGHYCHIDIVTRDGEREPLYMAKTFQGFEKAWEIAQAAALILQA